MAVVSLADFDALSPDDKLRLVQQLWARMVERDEVPLGGEVRAELERRLAEHEREPERTATWEEAVSRVRQPPLARARMDGCAVIPTSLE